MALRIIMTLALFFGLSQAWFPATSPRISSALSSARTAAASPAEAARRRELLLSRNGPHFRLDRFGNSIEFGATARLTTRLGDASPDLVAEWMRDSRGIAMSIWDERMTEEVPDPQGGIMYRFKNPELRFVTLSLSPSVDLRAWTSEDDGKFRLESVGFDTNLRLAPGVPAPDLGIEIEVAGELQPEPTGGRVSGTVAFQTKGSLPPGMAFLPEPALRAASDAINDTIVKFAIRNFESGARASFRDFMARREGNKLRF